MVLLAQSSIGFLDISVVCVAVDAEELCRYMSDLGHIYHALSKE